MSIALMAANIKQRQKIAHAGSYKRRLEEAKAETISAWINTSTQTCTSCGEKKYYKFLRCPDCGRDQI